MLASRVGPSLVGGFHKPLRLRVLPMQSAVPFVILALPRSRTTWLSAFLSYPPKRCGHDIAAESSSISDFLARLGKLDGTCETGAVIGWPLIKKFVPDVRIVVIKRPVDEIERSLAKFGVVPIPGELESRRRMLDACASSPGVTSFDFADLEDRDVCAWIFENCLDIEFDRKWYAGLAGQNIQVDVAAQMAKLRARQEILNKFKFDVAAQIMRLKRDESCAAL